MADNERIRIIYVSNDGKLQVLHELNEEEMTQFASGDFVFPVYSEDGVWGLITVNDALHNIDQIARDSQK